MSVLLVGIGNTLRRDDGVGAAVVERFAGRTDCRVLVVHQLLPEHVEELARCERVAFVDAAVNADRGRFGRLTACPSSPALGHTGNPAWLLTFCDSLYGRAPEAWLLTVPAYDLDFGEGLSEATREAIEVAVRTLADWLSRSRRE